LFEWWQKGKPSVLGAASGMVAGLAAITPASGFVSIPAALVIGFLAGACCYLAVTKLKSTFGYDDSLDVFGVHGVGSTLGMLLVGLFANVAVNEAIGTTCKLDGQVVSLAGSAGQLLNQMKGIAFTMVYAGVGTFLLLKLIGTLFGLRVSEEDETLGLDLSQHGESAYND
jgi:Amt family ammonium transporter